MPQLRNIFSVIFILALFSSIYYLPEIVFMLVASYMIAQMLLPIIDKLGAKIKSHSLSTIIIFVLFWISITIAFFLIVPVVYDQAALFISKIPKYEDYIRANLVPYLMNEAKLIDPRAFNKLSDVFNQITENSLELIFAIFRNLWGYTLITINIIIVLILLPVISFYFIKDRDLIQKCFNMLRLFLSDKAANFILDCVNLISQFIKGQLNVCLIMMCYYTFCLSVMNIDFALLLGVVSGLSVAIPFIGVIFSLTLTSLIAIFNLGIGHHLLYVVLTYIVGQVLEGYFISPKVIGDKIGIHPLFLIIALMIWGKLFGMVGLFVAIPMTCILKVLLKHLQS